VEKIIQDALDSNRLCARSNDHLVGVIGEQLKNMFPKLAWTVAVYQDKDKPRHASIETLNNPTMSLGRIPVKRDEKSFHCGKGRTVIVDYVDNDKLQKLAARYGADNQQEKNKFVQKKANAIYDEALSAANMVVAEPKWAPYRTELKVFVNTCQPEANIALELEKALKDVATSITVFYSDNDYDNSDFFGTVSTDGIGLAINGPPSTFVRNVKCSYDLGSGIKTKTIMVGIDIDKLLAYEEKKPK